MKYPWTWTEEQKIAATAVLIETGDLEVGTKEEGE